MKATGIVRKVDELGRVVLLVELRRTMEIAEKDSLEIYTDGETIVLRKYKRGCSMCGGMDYLITRQGKTLCTECRALFLDVTNTMEERR